MARTRFVVRIDGRLLHVEFRAEHEDGLVVGRGEVTRMVVARQRFLQGVDSAG